MLNVIGNCYESQEFVHWFICLQLACGARQRDLFDAELCSFAPTRKDGMIVQCGISKKRGGAKVRQTKVLIGLSTQEFLDTLTKFRSMIKADPRPVELQVSSWNHLLCEATRTLFPVDQERSGTHVNRALYAAMLRFSRKEKGTAVRQTQRALAHDKMASSLHYMYVDIE